MDTSSVTNPMVNHDISPSGRQFKYIPIYMYLATSTHRSSFELCICTKIRNCVALICAMVGTCLDILHFKASTTAQPSGIHHLVAAAVSTPNSSECRISNPPSLDNAQVNMHVPVHSENRTSARPMKTFGSGVGASNLILDGPSLNHGCSESTLLRTVVFTYRDLRSYYNWIFWLLFEVLPSHKVTML